MGSLVKMFIASSFISLLPILTLVSGYKSYDGYKVIRTDVLNKESSDLLHGVMLRDNIDFWREPAPGKSADLMVHGDHLEHVRSWLSSQGIGHNIMVDNVQSLISESQSSSGNVTAESRSGYTMEWTEYHPINVHNEFIQALADANDFARILNIGKSYEGRDTKVLAITKAGPGKPNVWLEAGIHAREWIAPAVATFIVRELVEDYEEHPDYLDKLNWYFIPSANPDGYAYSHEEDRMWRKTRSATGSIMGCKGVDPNRNWGYHFAESGVSNNKCSDIYPGSEAFSEVETSNIKKFVETLSPTPILGHCFHSYS